MATILRAAAGGAALRARYHPLGVTVDMETDSGAMAAAADRLMADWNGPPDDAARGLHVRISTRSDVARTGPPLISAHGSRLLLSAPGLVATADAATGTASASVPLGYAGDPELLREEVLDPLLLFLLARNGRTPIHAAGLLWRGHALLLAGPSGSGKSCLSLAAMEAGFRLLSDDMVFVQRQPGLRLWGLPRPIHLFAADLPAGGGSGQRLRGGKLKDVVPVAAHHRALAASSATLCLLARGERVGLETVSAAEALTAFDKPDAGFDLLRDDMLTAACALLRRPAWRLTLSDRPAEAVELLRSNFDLLTAAG